MKGKYIAVIVLAIVITAGVIGVVILLNLPRGEVPIDETFNSLAECTGSCMQEFTHMFDALLAVLEVVDQPLRTPRNHTAYNQLLYTFSVDQDLDGDTIGETVVAGSINAGMGTELSDGMQPPEVAAFSWTSITDLVETGRGAFSFAELSNSMFRIVITEETTVDCEDSCLLNFTSFGLHLNLTAYMHAYGNLSSWDLGDPWEGIYTGVIEFETHCNSDTLAGMMTFGTGSTSSDIATVTGTYTGASYTFTINLETFEVSTLRSHKLHKSKW